MRADELKFEELVDFYPQLGLIEFCDRRAVIVHADAMGALRKELVETLGKETAQVILTRYGYSCGYEDAGHLEDYMDAPSIKEFVLAGPRLHMFSGIAHVEPEMVETRTDSGHFRMSGKWRNSYEAQQHLRLFGRHSGPVCWTLMGYASGFATVAFQTEMICVETACQGHGDDHCAWTLMPADECTPDMGDVRKHFQRLNIQAQINLLEQKVFERTRELEASEQRYRDLIEDLPEVVFALNAVGRLVQLNRAGRSRLGVAAEDLPELLLTNLILPEQRRKAANFFKRVAQRREASKLDVVFRGAAGEFPAQLLVKPVFKGEIIVGYRGLAVDIKARQERERRLSQYASRIEHRGQQIQELVNDAIYITDRQGRLTYLNQHMARFLGMPAERLLGHAFVDFLPRSSAARLERDLQQRLRGEPAAPFEIVLPGIDGPDRLVEISTAVLDEDGRPSGVIGVVRDITARREMERQLAQSTRLASLGQFASGIAHEINNPIGLVSGYAEELQHLLESLPTDSPAAATLRRGLATIQDQALRCKDITQNLLSFARPQAVQTEPVDIAMRVRERLDFCTASGMTRGLDVALRLPAGLPLVHTDPSLLDQVLLNVVKNACDAMAGRGRLEVTASLGGTHLELEVADQGPGLPPGVIDKVFDPFFTTKPPGRGTGLGLSICYGIMGELGGRISCGNRPQGGAWFRIELPLNHAEELET